jgi:hypothetical protein
MLILLGTDITLMSTLVPYLVFRRLIGSAKRPKYRKVLRNFLLDIFTVGPTGSRPAYPPVADGSPHNFYQNHPPALTVEPAAPPMAIAALPSVVPASPPFRRPSPPTAKPTPAVPEPESTDGDDEGDDEAPPSAPSKHAQNGSVGGDESARRRSEIAIKVELGAALLREVIPILPIDAAKKMARTAVRYPEMATRIICAYAARNGQEVDPQEIMSFLSEPLDRMPALPAGGQEISEVG